MLEVLVGGVSHGDQEVDRLPRSSGNGGSVQGSDRARDGWTVGTRELLEERSQLCGQASVQRGRHTEDEGGMVRALGAPEAPTDQIDSMGTSVPQGGQRQALVVVG